MCLSAEVDLVAGLVVGAIGVDAVRHTRHRSEVPLACLPLLLGAHQLVEVFVWLGLDDAVSDVVGRSATYAYLLIAVVVLPVFVPVAAAVAVPRPRRSLSLAFVAVGLLVGTSLAHDLLWGPVTARVVGHHIDYRIDVWSLPVLIGFYVVATCGPLVTSELRHVRWFGGANLVAAVVLGWIDRTAFISLWCLWAAIASAAIAAHLRLSVRTGRPQPRGWSFMPGTSHSMASRLP